MADKSRKTIVSEVPEDLDREFARILPKEQSRERARYHDKITYGTLLGALDILKQEGLIKPSTTVEELRKIVQEKLDSIGDPLDPAEYERE